MARHPTRNRDVLLLNPPRELALARTARLAAEACAAADSPASAARACAALRGAILELREEGAISPLGARVLLHQIDDAEVAWLASAQDSLDKLPRLALEGAASGTTFTVALPRKARHHV